MRGYLCLGCCLSHSTNKECPDDGLFYGEQLNSKEEEYCPRYVLRRRRDACQRPREPRAARRGETERGERGRSDSQQWKHAEQTRSVRTRTEQKIEYYHGLGVECMRDRTVMKMLGVCAPTDICAPRMPSLMSTVSPPTLFRPAPVIIHAGTFSIGWTTASAR